MGIHRPITDAPHMQPEEKMHKDEVITSVSASAVADSLLCVT